MGGSSNRSSTGSKLAKVQETVRSLMCRSAVLSLCASFKKELLVENSNERASVAARCSAIGTATRTTNLKHQHTLPSYRRMCSSSLDVYHDKDSLVGANAPCNEGMRSHTSLPLTRASNLDRETKASLEHATLTPPTRNTKHSSPHQRFPHPERLSRPVAAVPHA